MNSSKFIYFLFYGGCNFEILFKNFGSRVRVLIDSRVLLLVIYWAGERSDFGK